MKFLCDQMLGTLAKWLRICGLDTYYAKKHMKDKKLIEIAKKENRVLITRDKELVYNSKREQIKTIKIETKDLDEQIITVLGEVEIDKNLVLTRCTICNSFLEKIPKKDVKEKVPERVFEDNKEFLYCSKCDKIYWKGTHYQKMLEKIEELKS